LLREKPPIGADLHGDEIPSARVPGREHDTREPLLDILEPLGAVLLHEARTLLLDAGAKLFASIEELVVVSESLSPKRRVRGVSGTDSPKRPQAPRCSRRVSRLRPRAVSELRAEGLRRVARGCREAAPECRALGQGPGRTGSRRREGQRRWAASHGEA